MYVLPVPAVEWYGLDNKRSNNKAQWLLLVLGSAVCLIDSLVWCALVQKHVSKWHDIEQSLLLLFASFVPYHNLEIVWQTPINSSTLVPLYPCTIPRYLVSSLASLPSTPTLVTSHITSLYDHVVLLLSVSRSRPSCFLDRFGARLCRSVDVDGESSSLSNHCSVG